MKKIEIQFREEIVTTKIVLVPNNFVFKEPDEKNWDNEEWFKFKQIEMYLNKCHKTQKLKSNQNYGDFYVHYVVEIF